MRCRMIWLLVVCCIAGKVDSQSGWEVQWLQFPNTVSRATAFSPDGSLLATTREGVVYFWESGTWRPLFSITGASETASSLSFSPDGRLLAVADLSGIARVFHTDSWNLFTTFSLPYGYLFYVAFDQTGQRIALSGSLARVWEVPTGRLIAETPELGSPVAFAPNGRYLAFGTLSTGSVVVYDVDTAQTIAQIPVQGTVQLGGIAFSPNGQWLAFVNGNLFYLVRTDTWQTVRTFHDIQVSRYTVLAFSPDSQYLFAAGGYASMNNTTVYPFRVLRVPTLAIADTVFLPDYLFSTISVHPNGRWVAMAWMNRALTVVDLETRTASIPVPYLDRAYDLAVAPSGEWYVTADSLRWMSRRDAATGQRLYRSPDGYHINQPLAVAISPDETLVATGGADNRIVLWEAATGAYVKTLTGHLGAVIEIAFLDNDTLLSVGADGTLRKWSVSRTQQIQSRTLGQQIHAAEVSGDRQWVALSGQDRRLRLFRVSDLQQVAQTDPLELIPNRVALSRTGRYTAVGLPNGKVRVYSSVNLQFRYERSFTSIQSMPLALTFSLDEKALLVGSARENRVILLSAYTGDRRFETEREAASGIALSAFLPDNRSVLLIRHDTSHLRVRYPFQNPTSDIDGDGCVSDSDLLTVLFTFGQTGTGLPEDINGDGTVDDSDLLSVLLAFGEGC